MTTETLELCPKCEKPPAICVCDRITKLDTRTHVLILQHPQELDKVLGTARITELSLTRATVRVGLSWASLSQAAGREIDPKEWGILYLGSLKKPLTAKQLTKPLVILDRLGEERDSRAKSLVGIVVIDGTWSQAKTLWWRNAWMLKLNRVILHPSEPSAYGRMREQSQRNHLATIEAVAEALQELGEPDAVRKQLKSVFRSLVQRARDAQEKGVEGLPPKPVKKKQVRRAPKKKGSRGAGPMD